MTNHSPDDTELRDLLNDAVADVEPRPALDRIRARTTTRGRSRSRRTWIWGSGGAMVATAATVLAVTALTGQIGKPDGAPDPGPAASSNGTLADVVPVYYVGDTSRGPRLFREFQPSGSTDELHQALDAAITGEGLMDQDYRSEWPAGTWVESASYVADDGQITIELRNDEVDIRERPAGMSAEEATVSIQQLVFTAQAALGEGDTSVLFVLDRGDAARPTVNDRLLGVNLPDAVRHSSTDDVFAQVWVIEPSEGKQVHSPFKVSGMASAFEGTVVWRLMQGDETVAEGHTTAEEGMTRSPYSFEVEAPPGDYTLVVEDTDPSGGEGFAPWQDTKEITVLGSGG